MDRGKVCAEMVFILEQVPYSYNILVPQKIKDKFKEKMDVEHYKSFTKEKIFFKQKINEETIKVLLTIFEKYWSNEDDCDFLNEILDK